MAEIKQVMDAAKAIMRQSGNMHQWSDGYPSEAVITADMERNGGLVIEDGGRSAKGRLLPKGRKKVVGTSRLSSPWLLHRQVPPERYHDIPLGDGLYADFRHVSHLGHQ